MRAEIFGRIIVVSFGGVPKKPVLEKTTQAAKMANVIIEIFDSERLVFNVTKHFLVPRHQLLTANEKESVLK